MSVPKKRTESATETRTEAEAVTQVETDSVTALFNDIQKGLLNVINDAVQGEVDINLAKQSAEVYQMLFGEKS